MPSRLSNSSKGTIMNALFSNDFEFQRKRLGRDVIDERQDEKT